MTEHNQKQLGRTRWSIADPLRGAMNADDFRDSFSFNPQQFDAMAVLEADA